MYDYMHVFSFIYPLEKIMEYISNLCDKNFIKVEVIKNDKNIMEEVVVLDDFYSKLSLLLAEDVNNVDNSKSNIFEVIEKEFGRTLSPIDYEIIKAWLDNHSEEVILEAVREASANGVSSIRYIDKILYEWSKLGIETIKDVENMKKKKHKKEEKEENKDIDLDIIDWAWFDEDE